MSDTAEPTLVELRTHGVSGTPPESLLGVPAIRWVGGSDQGRFFQASDEHGIAADVYTPETGERRIREGYHWGRMTSGGFKQAMWALLLPFALANTAQWMIPGTPEPGRPYTVGLIRAGIRVFGLILTGLFVIQVAYILSDIFATQCVTKSPGRQCLESLAPIEWMRDHDKTWLGLLVALGILALIFLAGLITKLSNIDIDQISDDPKKPRIGTGLNGPIAGFADVRFYSGSKIANPLRTIHGVAACCAAMLVTTVGHWRLTADWGWVWWAALGGFVACAGLVSLLDVLPDSVRDSLSSRVGVALVAASALAMFASTWWILPRRIATAPVDSHMRDVQYPIVGAIIAADAVLVIVTIALALLWYSVRTTWAQSPKQFRPWLSGFCAPLFMTLALLVASALGVGGARVVANCVSTGCIPTFVLTGGSDEKPPKWPNLPAFYDAIALQWGMLSILILLIGAATFGAYLGATDRQIPRNLSAPHAEQRAWFLARQNRRLHLILAFLMFFAAAFTIVSTAVWKEWLKPDGWEKTLVDGVRSLGLLGLAIFVLSLLFVIYKANRRPDSTGRILGVLWDLASLWPREAHPIVPPPYSKIAVPELVERVENHVKAGRRVVLCGHSQGSILMYAAIMRIHEEHRKSVSLLTYGSPIQWAYSRAFPGYLNFASHSLVMKQLEGRWINLIRFTDPIGGPLLSWGVEFVKETNALKRGVLGVDGVMAMPDGEPTGGLLRKGNERWLADPQLQPPTYPLRGHSDYHLDTRWDAFVAEVAPAPPGPPPEIAHIQLALPATPAASRRPLVTQREHWMAFYVLLAWIREKALALNRNGHRTDYR